MVSIDGTASVAVASKLMREADVDELVVTQTIAGLSVPTGIVSARDIVVRVVGLELDPALFTVLRRDELCRLAARSRASLKRMRCSAMQRSRSDRCRRWSTRRSLLSSGRSSRYMRWAMSRNPGRTVAAVFPSEHAADEAKAALLGRGVRAERISTSMNMTQDAVAAEAPGEAYGNAAPYGEAARAGTCVLTVNACSCNEERYLDELMRRHGARAVMRIH